MIMRRTQVRRSSSGRRPNLSWASSQPPGSVAIAANTKVLLSTIVTSVSTIDEVILRTRGIIAAFFASTATSEAEGAYGMYVTTDLAAAAGAASLPGPFTDGSDDGWFVWEPLFIRQQEGSAIGFENRGDQTRLYDSKAKRIVEEGKLVIVMVENGSDTAFNFFHLFRQLSQVRGTR